MEGNFQERKFFTSFNQFLERMIDEEHPDESLMTHNSVTPGAGKKLMYPPSRGFLPQVWERVRVLFERAIKSYFVDTLTENQICHPIPAVTVPLEIKF